MRYATEFTVMGRNIDELRHEATKRWQEFMGDSEADLPRDTEIHAEMMEDVTMGTRPVWWEADVVVRMRPDL